MESTAIQSVDLFANEIPALEQLEKLAETTHSSEKSRLEFTVKLENNLNKGGGDDCLANGIGLCILGRYIEAIEKLENAKDCKEKFFYLADAMTKRGRVDEAIKCLKKAADHGAQAISVKLKMAEIYRTARNHTESQKILQECQSEQNNAEYYYQLGRLAEASGNYEQARQCYAKAIEIEPQHKKALFHMAYRCDIDGDEIAAIDYYKQCANLRPVNVNTLLNMAVLYEDQGGLEKALKCVNKVLAYHPNHQRARLFKKDIESSMTMVYDEESEIKRSKRNQMLDTPISDFELSVRSRNCLKKMNIHTIGDLLRTSEAELLSYKNFGETSLREIKAILETKNLHLGMAIEDKQTFEQPEELTEPNDGLLTKPIDELQLSVRARKCLDKLNIRTFGDLVRKTEAELLGCKNFGVTSLNEIKKAVEPFGLTLRSLE